MIDMEAIVETENTLREYFVLSRGQWDADKSPQEIQQAIDEFYAWRDRLAEQGRMKSGQRLAREAKRVSRSGVMDGPYSEAKEVIGGYWFFMAASLQEAAELAEQNPCLRCGLSYEVRPVEPARASAFDVTNETPEGWGGRGKVAWL